MYEADRLRSFLTKAKTPSSASFLVVQQLDHILARLVRRAVAKKLGLKSTLDQCLGNTAFDLVKILNDACLNCPLSTQLFGEVG